MAKFDLKTALNLVPIMIGSDESSVKQIIDSVDYYSSILDVESQKQLISFVLKCRLSQVAKLKLSTDYVSVNELLQDMRVQLLPKKSSTAIQSRLHSCTQNNLSIDEYGKLITELFVDLTVTQSDGKPENYKVLKPINEKQAIKRFAEGLRNRRLSTIITARNFNSLKDAIQSAVDEETEAPSSSQGEIRAFNKNDFNYRRLSHNYFRAQRGRTFRGQSSRGQMHINNRQENPQSAARGHSSQGLWQNASRSRRNRGTSRSSFHYTNRNRWTDNSKSMHVISKNVAKNDNLESSNRGFVNKECIFSCDNNTTVSFFINSCSYRWLLDTGASISAIKYKHLVEQNIPFHNKNTEINGLGGKVQSIGYVYLDLLTHNTTFTHKFYVFKTLPCSVNGIIGDDFLRKHKSLLDYSNNTLTLHKLNGNFITLPISITRSNHFINNIIIPARSESIHFIQTNRLKESVVCSCQISEGVFIASSLIKPFNGKIPLRILNTTEKDLVINKIEPIIHDASDYNICSFSRCDKSVSRVKRIFSMLDLKHLNEEEKISIENLCAKYPDIFFLPGDKLTTTHVYQHSIRLQPNAEPVFVKPYRLPYSQKTEIKRQLDSMLADGIIEPCTSDWSSPILLVPKKLDASGEKKWRLVIDYRKLNDVIENDKFPLPNITEILDSLSGCIYFSHLDLHQAFYNVNLDKESRKYTAFCSGQYQMTRMPMGLKTSPSSFSRMMTIAMAGLNYEKCLVYQDDLVVYGNSLHHHNKNLLDIFERLRKVNLKLNASKCVFLKKDMLYLGHVISDKGVLPDPEKINVIQNYPVPQTVDEVKRFVAFANYYRKFIKNFADIAYPLNQLCKKNVTFKWNKKCQCSFEKLKHSLISPPILQYPNFSDDNMFTLQTDASGYGLGAVLSNKDGRPIAYASRSLNKAESNYPTIEKELLAIVWGVKHFRPYLYGRRFKIYTDHKPLVYLFNLKDPSSRLLKFRLVLEEYDYEISYVPGKGNAAADALSRVCLSSKELNEMHESVIRVMTRAQTRQLLRNNSSDDMVSTDDGSDQPKVVETHSKPKECVEMRMVNNIKWNKLLLNNDSIQLSNTRILMYVPSQMTLFINPASRSQLTPAAFVRELGQYCHLNNIDEVYFIKDSSNDEFIKKIVTEIKHDKTWSGPRLCILKDVQRVTNKDDIRVIINDFHLLPTSGHAGIRRMLNTIKKYYFWPNMERDIQNFVKKCHKCQTQKYSTYIKEPMVVTTTAHTAFEKIFLDIVGPLDRDRYNNYSYILNIQCELSKFVVACPLVTKSANEIAKNFVENFILKYGVPTSIATDRGAEFINTTMSEVCKLLHVNKLQSTAYHHESIGALENTHKQLGAFLRIQCNNYPDTWSTWLPYWCFSYNTSVHSATNYTPYELVYGKKCNLPSNLSTIVEPLYNHDSYPLQLKYRLQVSQNDARKNLIKTKIIRKVNYDSNINPIIYKPNDQILLKEEIGNKLSPIYSGPYVVIRDLSPNVEIIKKGKIDLVHKNRTKLYCS